MLFCMYWCTNGSTDSSSLGQCCLSERGKRPSRTSMFQLLDTNFSHIYSACNINVYCHLYKWLQTGFGLVIRYIDHLQIVTTSNYSTITNSHTLEFATACTKPSQSAVSTLVVAWTSNGGCSPYSGVPRQSPCLSYQYLTATAHND
jgi:hypothetical protein